MCKENSSLIKDVHVEAKAEDTKEREMTTALQSRVVSSGRDITHMRVFLSIIVTSLLNSLTIQLHIRWLFLWLKLDQVS